MSYRYVVDRADYTDLASGSVLHSAPGFPAFPVRLASEVFQRALALRGGARSAVLWDPCCGSGYLATVIGLVHRREVASVLATDVSPDALGLARENLALLDPDALDARAARLDARAERFGKPSYLAAAQAARRLGRGLAADGGALPAKTAPASVFDRDALAAAVHGWRPDVVVADVPYGEQTDWLCAPGAAGASVGAGPGAGVPEMLAAVASVLPAHAVLAVTARGRKVPLGAVRAEETFRIGTRAVALLHAAQLAD